MKLKKYEGSREIEGDQVTITLKAPIDMDGFYWTLQNDESFILFEGAFHELVDGDGLIAKLKDGTLRIISEG